MKYDVMPIHLYPNQVNCDIVLLIITRSITGESTKNIKKDLLILADSITGDIVLNNKLFITRSITLINISICKRSIG